MEENKEDLIKIIIGIIIFILAKVLKLSNIATLVIYIIGYLIVGGEVLIKAIKNIFKGEIFDENFLMSIATIGAFILGEYPEAMAVMLFYKIGEFCEDYSEDKSRKSISSLMDIRPDYANKKIDNNITKVKPDTIKINDIIVIKPGEKVPLDGKVIKGESMMDTSALTGESVPRTVKIDDDVISGCINMSGLLEVRVTKEFGEATVNKILDLVENAQNKKSDTEHFITKFAKYYTPAVVIIALFIAILPNLILKDTNAYDWIYRALTFLVVSCPCALVISIPLSFFGGIGAASKKGILIKGSNYLEALANTKVFVFDKTGTLTKGVFKVQNVNSTNGVSKDELLEFAAYAESYSSHPIAISLKEAYSKEIDKSRIKKIKEISGHGIEANIDDKKVFIGNIKLMHSIGIKVESSDQVGTCVYVAIDDKYAGNIIISDEIKQETRKALEDLKKAGVQKNIMLTGDLKEVAENVAKDIKIDKVYSELLPNEKVEKLEELIKEKGSKTKVAFVGDGINDAPVLARADIGIAMGGLGSDAAIEAADIVLMTDEIDKISTAIKISKKTLKIAKQNVIFAIAVKILVLILSAAGLVGMWAAVFADVGVTVLSILNSFRVFKQ